jgi:arabinofuranan 3-O-arabinosyltransferase
VLWVVLAEVVLLSSFGSFVVDTKPELYLAPWRSAASYLSAWQANPQLGFPSFNVGLAPVAVAVGVIQGVGIPAELSVRVLRLLLFAVGSLGAARLFRALQPGTDRLGPLVAGTVFVANPYVVVAGATQAILLPWALLPWQLLCLVRALRVPDGAGRWARWRWPAGFALAFAATSGMNAGVVPLFQLVAVPVVVAVLRPASWRRALAVVGRCAVLVVAVSLYWILPSVLALGAGAAVVDNSETPQGISGPSSAAEVLRGLGLWPLYGSGGRGVWLPEFAAYVRSPVVVLASFALPVLAVAGALLCRGRLRRLGVGLLLVAVPIMVGLFPVAHPTPFGRALGWAFGHVPFAGAFRTTNKVGAVLVLGVTLLVAGGVVAARRRWPGTGARAGVAVLLALVLAGSTLPAWTGNLYVSSVNLPPYWQEAAAALDAGPADQRVWLVPGEVQASYRWTEDRPDDLSTSVLDRPSLVRTVIPVTSAPAANLLAALDGALQERRLAPGALSTAARYLGVGDLLLRNDVVWENTGGARPVLVRSQLDADPGLRQDGSFGGPGQNTTSATVPPQSAAEAELPPLQRYAVDGARAVTRTDAAAATVLVDGDGGALAPLAAAGLLPGSPSFRYLADLSPAQLAQLLPETARIVLTDTNRRRSTVAGRLANGTGPLLPEAADPGGTRSLGAAGTQTTLTVSGGSATATDSGSAFGPVAAASPENTADGDPRTAWEFGDFDRAVGQSLTLRFPTRAVPRVSVAVRGGAVAISRVRIQIGSAHADLDVGRSGVATYRPPAPVRSGAVTVTVLATSGEGFGRVGIDEVTVPGVRLTRVGTLPATADRLVAGLSPAARAALDRTPIDVLLTRARGADPGDDEETGLARDLTLPVGRTAVAAGTVRPSAALPETDVDRLAGYAGPVRATSTSRAFGLPTVRASQALDGRPDTAWMPAAPVVGQSLQVSAPPRRVDHVELTQVGRNLTDWATRVRVSLDGKVVATAPARHGTTRISFPARTASRLQLTILATHSGTADTSVRISEVDFGGARIRPAPDRTGCVPVAVLDGHPLWMRPAAPVTTADPVPWVGCDSLYLGPGAHQLRPVAGWQPDDLVLRDTLGAGDRRPPPGPRYSVTPGRAGSATVHIDGAHGAWYLVSGQAYDPRWRASVDGHDLGAPVLVDGYAAGWRVDLPGSRHVATIRYGPQRVTDAGLALSGLGILGCLLLLVLRAPSRRWPLLRPAPAPAPAGATGPAGPVPTWVGGRWTAPAEGTDWSPPPPRPIAGSADGSPPTPRPTAEGTVALHLPRRPAPPPDLDAGAPPPVPPGSGTTEPGPAAGAGPATGPGAAAGAGPAAGPDLSARPGDAESGPAAGAGPAGVGPAGVGPAGAGPAGVGPGWPARVRAVGAWLAVVVAAGLLGGLGLAAAAVVLAGWHLVRPPAPRTLLRTAAALLAAVPLVWLALRPDTSAGLSARVVADDQWPHRLATLALLLLAVGVTRAERRRR